jgi:hypothetical protein
MLPPGNTLPGSHRNAKKILTIVGLPCEFIHSCKNDCVLFRGEVEKLVHCPKCGGLDISKIFKELAHPKR